MAFLKRNTQDGLTGRSAGLRKNYLWRMRRMKSFIVEKKYILFPISMDAPCKMVTVCSEGEKIFEFDLSLIHI